MYEEEIRKLLGSKKLIIGEAETRKHMAKGEVAKVYIASNCKASTKADFDKYSKLSGFELLDTKVPNDDLGTVCKKPFAIAVISILK